MKWLSKSAAKVHTFFQVAKYFFVSQEKKCIFANGFEAGKQVRKLYKTSINQQGNEQ